MSKYTKNLFNYFVIFAALTLLAIVNWRWPLYIWLGDTILYRFIWLGVFFVILDVFVELILQSVKQIQLAREAFHFSHDLHKLEKGFQALAKVVLPNSLRIDFVVVGPSGIWTITAKDGSGKVVFDGDNLIQNGTVLDGLITKSLEKAYTLGELLKNKLHRDFKIAPVVAFSSPVIDLSGLPDIIKGVYLSSHKNINSLIMDTDVQILDSRAISEIIKILKNA